jgi:cation transport ATPase
VTEPDLVPPEPAPRRYPSTIGGALYLLALAGVVVGIFLAALEDWRLGVRWMAGALLFAAVCRLLLPSRQAGMLAVRHRALDVGLLVVVGVVLFFLAGSIPNQPI